MRSRWQFSGNGKQLDNWSDQMDNLPNEKCDKQSRPTSLLAIMVGHQLMDEQLRVIMNETECESNQLKLVSKVVAPTRPSSEHIQEWPNYGVLVIARQPPG